MTDPLDIYDASEVRIALGDITRELKRIADALERRRPTPRSRNEIAEEFARSNPDFSGTITIVGDEVRILGYENEGITRLMSAMD